MRKVFKILGWLVAVALLIVGGLLAYFLVRYPQSGEPPDVTVEATPERMVRGEYLFNSVALCGVCHSGQDESGAFPYVDPAAIGQGGGAFPLGEAGIVYARNITPAAIGEWTDGQLIRALRDGVNAKGEALFPIMPYTNYRHLAQGDL